MTLERAFEACASQPQICLRAEKRRVAREQFGLCVCGTPIAWHYSETDDRLPCDHPDVIAARLHTALQLAARKVGR